MILKKLCFVSVGATASFEKLIRQVLNEAFLAKLAQHKFTHLLIQYGKDGEALWNEFVNDFPEEHLHGVRVGGFDFKPELWPCMHMATKTMTQDLGIVISHAGTGTILEALRLALPLIIVPNADLAGNHQVDLAAQMQDMKYAIHADVDNLLEALDKAEAQRSERPSRVSRPYGHEDTVVDPMADQLYFVD
ncbi:hypothetical protein N7532_011844 [Penicillium argentinense]|uniref:UDP-N-acetylglucosamine transferase subunit ALG13 n=1 Tax=Penicillium argentinense TaxID=1131581 RepID=A0A9W9JVE6_9EURO|nr:uncharacterized protein N7532_011844 [Penicillium argentinense]KAJ5082801.1 hypothetical protein N7532_011844 [Penicillium argentinense]